MHQGSADSFIVVVKLSADEIAVTQLRTKQKEIVKDDKAKERT